MTERRARRADDVSGDITRRELYFFNLYRLLESVIYLALVFSPLAVDWIRISHSQMGRVVALVYCAVAAILLITTERMRKNLSASIGLAIALDTLAASLVLFSISGGHSSIPMMLMVNVGVCALLLPFRQSLALATLAAVGVMAPPIYAYVNESAVDRSVLEATLFGLAYLAVAALCAHLGRQMRETEALAEQRGVDLLNLEQVNDLIIRRMKTGVLLVDDANHILRINESAWHLIGNPSPSERDLGQVAAELSRRLYHWRHSGRIDQNPVALAADVPEVIPRFSRMAPNDDTHILIFLDDTSLLSRRAEEMTLASLGRLSASIAHEIRNPLAAIRYSAQLLAESESMEEEDRRLVEIVNNHCTRANEVIENILQLSRRERSRPESIDVNAWALNFVEEYKQNNDLGQDHLRAITQNRQIEAMVDPQHLQQVVWNLVQNAIRYGREPGAVARVVVVARLATDKGPPLLEVVDRGPGIPAKVAAQIFDPFYTTSEYGTGLGLYLARQMCESSQATLEYVPVAGGGACFRITLSAAATLVPRGAAQTG
ncbi:PAS domain-containing sensor histidine kinase [Dokdonella sp.]|uniref:sensor histidine kinase n=1 Tax=Dokdonella sp. TaxID=2291710 RepID=UPI003526F054